MMGMKCLTGMLLVRAILDKIELVKLIYTMDIQDESEVYIDPVLS